MDDPKQQGGLMKPRRILCVDAASQRLSNLQADVSNSSQKYRANTTGSRLRGSTIALASNLRTFRLPCGKRGKLNVGLIFVMRLGKRLSL
jgi:hypothetical protein